MTGRALVVGVPHTSYAGLPDLPGALIDVERIEHLLETRGFEIRSLSDPPPTRTVVQEGLLRLIADTLEGDLSVIYFSGHGYRLLDGSGDENDSWDEALVCADGPIVDDWFRDSLWSGVVPGSRFVAIVDACHSDSAVLGLRVSDDEVLIPPLQPSPVEGVWRVVLAACRDKESTLDLGAGDKGGGVATAEMLDIVENHPGISYRDLWGRVATNVRNLYPNRGIGVPHLTASGPDDSLLSGAALTTGVDVL